ncbi:MAG: type II secretion system F family protein [Haloferacaceae archaeon]
MSLLHFVPLGFALAGITLVVVSSFSDRLRRLTARLALPLFGAFVSRNGTRRNRQRALLRSAHVGETHRVFASRTLLFGTVLGISGSVVGVYAVAGVLTALTESSQAVSAALPPALSFLSVFVHVPSLSIGKLFLLLLTAAATVGTGLAAVGYWARWQFLEQRAVARASQIEATVPRTVAFVYALSRSGMPFPKVLQTLTRNEGVYGEAARELGVVVREMNVFGVDVITALQRMSDRTPSDSLEEFGENLASVLGSGRQLSTFLRQQYERYQEEAEAQQERYLELLGTLAEVYVTVLVAGPLFFVTVLVVIGLVMSNTLPLVRFLTYVAIPLASAGFVVYVDSVAQSSNVRGEYEQGSEEPRSSLRRHRRQAASDGGVVADRWQANRERLRTYDRFRQLRRWLERPVESVLRNPQATLLVTVPVGLLYVALESGPVPLGPGAAGVLDEPVVLATVFVLGVYTVVHEIQKRRVHAIETEVPDFLDRLASVNEAGMTIVGSIHRVADSDLGALGDEMARVRRDIRWGADARTALRRMDRRVGTPMVSRAVTLITNAMTASSDVAPVLRIAATEAHDTRQLQQRRRDEMLTYLVVIYISFLVFLAIVVALSVSFIPAIESATSQAMSGVQPPAGMGSQASIITGVRDVNTAAYHRLLFHVTAVQAVCSGLIAGKLGEGSVHDGLKHSATMLLLTYLMFQFV